MVKEDQAVAGSREVVAKEESVGNHSADPPDRIVPMITRFGHRSKSGVVRVAHAGERSAETDGEVAFGHGDEEFFMLLNGRLGCKLGAEEHVLHQNDCLHFRSNLPHGFWGDSPGDFCEALVVMWTYSGKSVLFPMPNA